MSEKPRKDWRKVGTKVISVMLYGSGGRKMKNIHRIIYSEKTNHPRQPIYWFELKRDQWRNTMSAGIRIGIVVSSSEFRGLREKL